MNPAEYQEIIRYAKRAPIKMAPWKDLLLPYVKGKKILDWGSGPGYRAKVLLDWGAAEVLIWDPALDSKKIYDLIFKEKVKSLKWFDEGTINFDKLPDISTDILFTAGVQSQVGPDPYGWWNNVVSKINAKYYICIWHTGGTDQDIIARDDLPLSTPNRTPDHFSMYTFNGFNKEPGDKIFKSDPRLKEIAHKKAYLPEHYSFSHVPMQLLLFERKDYENETNFKRTND